MTEIDCDDRALLAEHVNTYYSSKSFVNRQIANASYALMC